MRLMRKTSHRGDRLNPLQLANVHALSRQGLIGDVTNANPCLLQAAQEELRARKLLRREVSRRPLC